MTQSSLHSLLRVGLCMLGLLGLTWLFSVTIGHKPLYIIEPHHIVLLFAASNTSFLCSTLLLLWRVATRPTGAVGISLHAQRLNLLAALLRAIFVLGGGVFSQSWLSRADAILSVLGGVALLLVLEPTVVPRLFGPERVGASPENFHSAKLGFAIIAVSLVGLYTSRVNADNAGESIRWVALATAIYLQAAAMLPQRAMFLRTKRLPAITSHAFFLLAIAGVLRLSMWFVLMLEAEFHIFIMLGDFLHVALLADFVMLYTKQGIGGLLDGSEMLISNEESV